MIYYYVITIEFCKGGQYFLKKYYKNFLEIGELFVYLETKHKGNYKVYSIKERRYRNGIQF